MVSQKVDRVGKSILRQDGMRGFWYQRMYHMKVQHSIWRRSLGTEILVAEAGCHIYVLKQHYFKPFALECCFRQALLFSTLKTII